MYNFSNASQSQGQEIFVCLWFCFNLANKIL